MSGVIGAVIALCLAVALGLLFFGTKPDCPTGTVGVFYQYSGWACVAGAKP